MAGPSCCAFDFSAEEISIYVGDDASEEDIVAWNDFLDSVFPIVSRDNGKVNSPPAEVVKSSKELVIPKKTEDVQISPNHVEVTSSDDGYAECVFEVLPLGEIFSNPTGWDKDNTKTLLKGIDSSNFRDRRNQPFTWRFVRDVKKRNAYFASVRKIMGNSRPIIKRYSDFIRYERIKAGGTLDYFCGDTFKLKVFHTLDQTKFKHLRLGSEIYFTTQRGNRFTPHSDRLNIRKRFRTVFRADGFEVPLSFRDETGYDIDCRNKFFMFSRELLGSHLGKDRSL